LRVSDSTNVIDHNITYDTTAHTCPDWYYAPGSAGHQCDPQTIQVSMITNVLHSDPLFVSPGSTYGDWHLMGSSPAIRFSNQSYVQTLDHDGNVRTNPADAGCYD